MEYIDTLIEKAFCDGYEYAQREFTMSKALKEEGRKIMARKMGLQEKFLENKNLVRKITSPGTMWNGTYAKDMNLDKAGKLNLKITREGNGAMTSWSGAHGTTLGNAKRR